MTYPKISQEISDPVNENIQKLAGLFPSAVKDGELDIDALKQELGQFEEVGSEKYELTWAGKQEAKQTSFKPIIGKTLKYIPEDSKHPDTTENLFIEGDNLEALKLLRQNYYGAVKMIYIDPPYNTGSDFVYNDNFKMSKEESDIAEGNMSELGERYTKNRKDQNRYHTNWLNMMYPRLRLAKDLLKNDGVIFISIDDNEVHNMRKLCDEIFGEENFLNCIAVKLSESTGVKMAHVNKRLPKLKEYILFYKNQEVLINPPSVPKGKWDKEYKHLIIGVSKKELNIVKSVMNDDNMSDKKLKMADDICSKITLSSVSKLFEIHHNISESEKMDILKDNAWRIVRDVATTGGAKIIADKKKQETDAPFFIIITPQSKKYLIKSGYSSTAEQPRIKLLFADHYLTVNPGDFWGDIKTTGLDNEGYVDFRNGKKPLKALKRIINTVISGQDIVLDFFAGSATTAHAVMQLNAEDGGNRKFIMVQLPELCEEKSESFKAKYKNICDIGKERIRRAGEKILEENKEKEGIKELDIGFKVFRIGDTNINWLHQDLRGEDLFEHYDKNASDKDKLDFTPDFTDMDVVYEIMLRQTDIPLSSKVEQLTDIGERTYIFADSFLVCLEQTITWKLVDLLAAIEPLPVKFVFRDSAFDDDIALKDETFRTLSALIERNSCGEKQTYTVEFI
ncbi:MAG: site-specific DNA-methyltransferase [Deltaproteobacteria bacterium]|nr:site-specific DNA-methyltransferase [Deltaproteobacteria bacterium]